MLFDCFPEPSVTDNTWARYGESTPSWLQRSTLPRAGEVRAFVNRNIACLPEKVRSEFCHALKVRWPSALFELVVARGLQLLGGSIEIDPGSGAERHPDFRASFDGQMIVVEAIAPVFDQDIKQEEKIHTELIPIIERCVPDGWSILLDSLPLIGPSESKTPLKRALKQIFSGPLRTEDDGRQIRIELERGILSFTLIRGVYGESPIVGSPIYVGWSDSKERILHALKKKGQQVRAQDAPVLLAVHAAGISSEFRDFDSVLFGDYVTRLDRNLRPVEMFFDPKGVFAKETSSSTYAGVWAFLDLSPFGCKGPVLYVRPGVESEMPPHFDLCERRFLREDGIYTKAGKNPRFLDQIGWAKL